MTVDDYREIIEEAKYRFRHHQENCATQEWGIRENVDYWIAKVAWELAQAKAA